MFWTWGIPLLTSPYVTTTNNVVWGVLKQFGYFVLLVDRVVESDRSVFFTSDRVALRAITRVGFAFLLPGGPSSCLRVVAITDCADYWDPHVRQDSGSSV